MDPDLIRQFSELKFLGNQDQATFINIETLFGVLLGEIRILAPNLGSYSSYLARTALRTVQFYLSSEIDTRYFMMDADALLKDKSFLKLMKAFEKRFLRRVRVVTKITFDTALQNGFAFLDIYGLIQWHRRFHNQSENPVYFLAEIEADHVKLQQQLFMIFAGLIWHSEKELGFLVNDFVKFVAEGNKKHLLRYKKYKMLRRYVRTTRLPFLTKRKLLKLSRTPVELADIKLMISETVINNYMLEQTILLSLIDEDIEPFQIPFIREFAGYMEIDDKALQVRISSVAAFFHYYEERFDFIKGNRALFHMRENLNKQLTLIIRKNLDRIVNEIKRTGKLYTVITKSDIELSAEEKKFIREQLLSIAKTIPALAIFCLPAGGMVLAILIKVLPFNILPNSFAECIFAEKVIPEQYSQKWIIINCHSSLPIRLSNIAPNYILLQPVIA